MNRDALAGLDLHIDCPAGVAGDMFVAATLDLGVPKEAVDQAIAALGVGIQWSVRPTLRKGLSAKQVEVSPQAAFSHAHGHDGPAHRSNAHVHRPYREIRSLLERLSPGVGRRALGIFDRIAQVEADLHGTSVAEVSFHEVGAVDSIFDVVAAAAALEWLAPRRVTCRRVALGSGTVSTQHGQLPVPAPATVALLLGAPVESGDAQVELTTPTGAAILAASVDAWSDLPPLVLRASGYGAGTRELEDRPNVVRLLLGTPLGVAPLRFRDSLWMVEANLDDMVPELAEPMAEALYRAGALDVWFVPVYMKKGRPAFEVRALTPVRVREAVESVLMQESTSLGVRRFAVERSVLDRRIEQVATPYGPIDVKVGLLGGKIVNLAPEYESVRRCAAQHGIPAKRVYQAAIAAAEKLVHGAE